MPIHIGATCGSALADVVQWRPTWQRPGRDSSCLRLLPARPGRCREGRRRRFVERTVRPHLVVVLAPFLDDLARGYWDLKNPDAARRELQRAREQRDASEGYVHPCMQALDKEQPVGSPPVRRRPSPQAHADRPGAS
jgi:hypothetical protein